MKTLVAAALFGFVTGTISAAEPLPTVPPEAAQNAEAYGQYPIAYKDIVTQWLHKVLVDADSAVTEFITEPKVGEMTTKKGEVLTGYLVEFRVNSRNKFGLYTGMQKHGALVRNGEVIRATGFAF